jgi:hypothetical protein
MMDGEAMNRLLLFIKQFWMISGVQAVLAVIPGAQQAHADATGTKDLKPIGGAK